MTNPVFNYFSIDSRRYQNAFEDFSIFVQVPREILQLMVGYLQILPGGIHDPRISPIPLSRHLVGRNESTDKVISFRTFIYFISLLPKFKNLLNL